MAVVELPGGHQVIVAIAGGMDADRAMDLAGEWVAARLGPLLNGAGPAAKRAYCLALGGGFDQ